MKKQLFLLICISFWGSVFSQEYNEITFQLNKSGASPQGNSNGWVFSNLTFNLKIVQNQLGPDTYRTHGDLTDSYTVDGYRHNGKLYKLGEKPFVNHESFSGYKKLRITLADGGSIRNFEKTGGGFTLFEIDAGYKTLKDLSKIKFQNIEILEFTDNHMEYVLNNYLKSEKQNEPTQISNTNDDFWNGSASNSSSTTTSTQTQQNSNKTKTSTNTSGLTSKQIKAHEDFKQKQQEQMQYMQAKIAESRQNAQNIQNAANATEMAWKNGNYIQGSSYLANEYARQGNESAAYGTIAVGVGLDIYSSIKADRERKKAQEAQQAQIDAERKRVEAEKKAYLESLVKKRRLVLTDILKYKYPKYSDDYGSTAYFYCFYMTDVNVGEWTPEVGITQVFEIPKYKDNTWPFQEATENKLKPYHKNPVNLIGGFKSYEDAAQSLTKLTTTFSETGVALTLIDVSKDFPNNTNVISNDSKSSAEQTDFWGNPAETKKTNTKSNKNSSSSNKKTKEDDFWGKSIKD